jgi:hypothetical protein
VGLWLWFDGCGCVAQLMHLMQAAAISRGPRWFVSAVELICRRCWDDAECICSQQQSIRLLILIMGQLSRCCVFQTYSALVQQQFQQNQSAAACSISSPSTADCAYGHAVQMLCCWVGRHLLIPAMACWCQFHALYVCGLTI